MNLRKKRVNDLAIIVLDSKIYTVTGVTDQSWIAILEACESLESAIEAKDDFEVEEAALANLLDLIEPSRIAKRLQLEKDQQAVIAKLDVEPDKEKRLKKAKRIADISGLFEYDEEGMTYLKGFRIPMNGTLVDALLEAHYNPASRFTVSSLINFWKFLLLNPDKHVRTGLFDWIKTSTFAITEDGNIISYRNVDVKSRSTSKKLDDFISESWAKVKRWKKSPSNYVVVKTDDSFGISEAIKYDGSGTLLGNLDYLFTKECVVGDETIYTDNYTHTMEILLGKPVSMPRNECDNDPNSSCSRGLHCKSKRYGLQLGSDVIITLVNPYNVVAIPNGEFEKFRCCEYLPLAKAEIEKGKLVEFEPGTYDLSYDSLTNLKKLLEVTSIEELQTQGLVSEELLSDDFKDIFSLAVATIAKRVITK